MQATIEVEERKRKSEVNELDDRMAARDCGSDGGSRPCSQSSSGVLLQHSEQSAGGREGAEGERQDSEVWVVRGQRSQWPHENESTLSCSVENVKNFARVTITINYILMTNDQSVIFSVLTWNIQMLNFLFYLWCFFFCPGGGSRGTEAADTSRQAAFSCSARKTSICARLCTKPSRSCPSSVLSCKSTTRPRPRWWCVHSTRPDRNPNASQLSYLCSHNIGFQCWRVF